MSLIPQPFIEDLLDRTDIVEVIDSRVKLKKAGKNYLACCPFHKEKTPSFSVSPDKQFYYCFGCGASGTAITFLLQYEHLNFVDAVESLARVAGLKVPRAAPEAAQRPHRTLYEMLERAASYYQQQLREHPNRDQAVQYLKQRGLTGAICKSFGNGFAPPGWDNLQVKLGLSEADHKLLENAGLVVVNEENRTRYDRFRNRIMFPILDSRGRTIGFGGRVLAADDKGPKYLNSPETEVIHKGRELYGLVYARQQRGAIERLLVVEGYMDVIALAQFGIHNAVATLGTACGEEHLKLAFRHTSEVVFCFDGDAAGRKAARRALESALPAMTAGRQVKFLFLPDGQDPDTLVRQIGLERFQAQVAQAAIPLEEFFFEAVAEGLDQRTMEGRATMSKRAAPLLQRLPSGVFRQLMFDYLARRTGLGVEVLQELIVSAPVGGAPASERRDDSARAAPPEQAPSVQYERPTRSVPAPPRYPSSARPTATRLSPVRIATSLLLEFPELASSLADWQVPGATEDEAQDTADGTAVVDADLERLRHLLGYLNSRPQASFHGILGYWGGRYGLEAQKALAALVADRFLGAVKRTAPFDALKELRDACRRIDQRAALAQHEAELAQLVAMPHLTDAQNQRLKELLQLKTRARQISDPTKH